MIEYSLTREDFIDVFTEIAHLAPGGRLPGSTLFGGPKQQAEFAVKTDVLPVGPRQLWADDGGLHERRGGRQQTFRWWALGEILHLEEFVAILQPIRANEVPAFAAIVLLLPRGLPGVDELVAQVAERATGEKGGVGEPPVVPVGATAGLVVAPREEDYLAMNKAFQRSAEGKKQMRIVGLAALVGGLVFGGLLAVIPGVRDIGPSPVLVGVLGGLVVAGAIVGMVLRTVPKQVRHLIEIGVYKLSPGAWWCDDQGLHEEIEGRRTSMSWASIERVQRLDDGVALIWLGAASAVLVPCRDLQGRQFIDAVERSLGQRSGN